MPTKGLSLSPARGVELAYAEITANQASISTITDVTGLSISFTVGARPVMLFAFFPVIQQVTSTGAPTIFITDGSNNAIARFQAPSIAANGFSGGHMIMRRLPAGTGAYTAKVRAQTSAGTLTIAASGTAYQAFVQALEV